MANQENLVDDILLHQDHKALFFLQDEAHIGLWEVVIDSKRVYWSDITKSIHEVSEDYIPTFSEAVNFYQEGYHRNRIQALFKNAVDNGDKFDDEFVIITKRGIQKWVRSVGVPVFSYGRCQRVYGAFQDIDARKKAEINLKLSEQEFRQTFLNAPNGMAQVALDGSWLKVNSKVSEILGYTEAELLKLNFQKLTHPDDLDKDLELLSDLLEGKINTYQMEKRYYSKLGSIVWCLLSVSLVKSDTGHPLYFISQLNEITNLKKANAIINDLLEETKRQNEKLLNFKHIVSHNLKSHTSNLDILFDFLRQDIPDLKDVEIFNMLINAFKNLQETIIGLSKISDFERVSKDDFKSIAVKEILDKSVTNLRALIDKDNSAIISNIPNDLKVLVIPEYLESIFLNIITNAIKYRKEDVPLVLEINTSREKGYKVLSFKDNGLGIDVSLHKDKIFGMYKTFHENKNARGLGLFIVKNQIEAMGGRITVESEVTKGSIFKVYLKEKI